MARGVWMGQCEGELYHSLILNVKKSWNRKVVPRRYLNRANVSAVFMIEVKRLAAGKRARLFLKLLFPGEELEESVR